MTVLISTIPTTNSTNPWQLMGVKFTPSVDIWVTKLGAWQANSSTTVKLWNSSYSEIASATVVSNSAWAYTTITTIKLTAGTVYYLTVNCTNGWSYNSQTFPFTSGSVQLNENFFTSQTTPNSYSLDNSSMYGVPSFDYTTTDPSAGGGGTSNYVFTNCGATGRSGPTQAQANSTYASGNKLYNKVTIVGSGIQEFIVAKSGVHTIEAVGAKGGYQGEFGTTSGGKPAKMKGNFTLSAGDKLRILVGQMGTNAGSDQDAGGGGGTFVVKVDPASSYTMWDGVKVTPLIVAGGGGGDSADAQGSNASTTTSSTGSTANTSAGNGATFGNGGGGGGFLTGGQSANGGAGGASFLSGGLGGSSTYNGGFGGGAGGNDEYGAGGGGYTGGPGYDGPSGGGGSYNAGTSQLNSVDTSWQTHGQVTITEPLNTKPNAPTIAHPVSTGSTISKRPPVVANVPTDADGGTVKIRATFSSGGGAGGAINYSAPGVQTYVVPSTGDYVIEAWGAEGGRGFYSGAVGAYGGKGGYSKGTVALTAGTTLYITVGGKGGDATSTANGAGGSNGGGAGGANSGRAGGGGGGASDVRVLVNNANNRIIVAGGGGGGSGTTGSTSVVGGYGGGTTGQDGIYSTQPTSNGKGGTQSAGGGTGTYGSYNTAPTAGTFGSGGNGAASTNYGAGGGGGGWYGGGGADYTGGGGGGSGYVLTSTSTKPGSYFAENASYYLSNTTISDGGASFLSPTGVSETGHSGDGYVRITTPAGSTYATVESGFVTQGTGTVSITPNADLPSGTITVTLDAYDGSEWSTVGSYAFNIVSAPTFNVSPTATSLRKTDIDSLETCIKNAKTFRGLNGSTEIIVDAIIAEETPIKKAHLEAMRAEITTLLSEVGITPTWTDPVITSDTVRKGQHWLEIYNYLMQI